MRLDLKRWGTLGLGLTIVACSSSDGETGTGVQCGEGTHLEDGLCVADSLGSGGMGGDDPSGGKSGSGASHSGGVDGSGASASGGKSNSGGTNGEGGTGGEGATSSGGTGGEGATSSGGTGGEGATSSGGTGGEGATSSGGGTNNSGGSGGGIAVDTCFDEMLSADESDVDCGGPSDCRRCDVNEACSVHVDCSVGFCKSNLCTEPACDDNEQNGTETDVDCGGECAPANRCVEGQGCKVHEDCDTSFCDDGMCASHCSSAAKDGDETDVDCGGSLCDKCSNDKACTANADCMSGICTDNICVAPSCNDGSKNQDEPALDCGGVCSADLDALTAKRCALNDDCKVANDCDSFVCTALKCVPDAAYDPTDVIDTFEDQNPSLPTNEGRKGVWYQFHDSSGANQSFGIESIPGTRGAASQYALHTSGSGYTSWGAGIGVDLNNSGGTKSAYDASAYVGVTFWARTATTSASGRAIKVLFPDGNSVYNVAGGLTACKDIPTVGATSNNCDGHLYVNITLSNAWQKYTVNFADLMPEGYTTTLATNQLVSIQFRTATGATFDFWIDDLVFIPAPTP
jgi:hypothetical protein